MSIMPPEPDGKIEAYARRADEATREIASRYRDPLMATFAINDFRDWLDEDEAGCGHHSWAGLMALLDEHWPADIFPTRYPDDIKRDAVARIVSLLRWVDRLRGDI